MLWLAIEPWWRDGRWGPLPCSSMGWAEQRAVTRHEAIGGAKRRLYIHVSSNPSPSVLGLLALCYVISVLSRNTPSLPPSCIWHPMNWRALPSLLPPAPSCSPSCSITLMLCGSARLLCFLLHWSLKSVSLHSLFHPLFVSSLYPCFLCQWLDFKCFKSSFGENLTGYPFLLLLKVIVINMCKWADVSLRGTLGSSTALVSFEVRNIPSFISYLWLVFCAVNICWHMKQASVLSTELVGLGLSWVCYCWQARLKLPVIPLSLPTHWPTLWEGDNDTLQPFMNRWRYWNISWTLNL